MKYKKIILFLISWVPINNLRVLLYKILGYKNWKEG